MIQDAFLLIFPCLCFMHLCLLPIDGCPVENVSSILFYHFIYFLLREHTVYCDTVIFSGEPGFLFFDTALVPGAQYARPVGPLAGGVMMVPTSCNRYNGGYQSVPQQTIVGVSSAYNQPHPAGYFVDLAHIRGHIYGLPTISTAVDSIIPPVMLLQMTISDKQSGAVDKLPGIAAALGVMKDLFL
ncbi:hypothetical protein EON65_35920 [archaeon]|nr:MAG: hypothetical protein EON65_35920 [archaeon]